MSLTGIPFGHVLPRWQLYWIPNRSWEWRIGLFSFLDPGPDRCGTNNFRRDGILTIDFLLD